MLWHGTSHVALILKIIASTGSAPCHRFFQRFLFVNLGKIADKKKSLPRIKPIEYDKNTDAKNEGSSSIRSTSMHSLQSTTPFSILMLFVWTAIYIIQR